MSRLHDPAWLNDYRPRLRYYLKQIFYRLTQRLVPASTTRTDKSLFNYAHYFGVPVWAELIKTNRAIWESGPEPVLWGQVLYSPDARPEVAFEKLPAILERIQDLLEEEDSHWDFEVRSFLMRVRDIRITLTIIPVPESISPDIRCVISDCVITRKGLPDGKMKRAPLPVLMVAEGKDLSDGYVSVMHHKRWPESFHQAWNEGFDSTQSAVGNAEMAAIKIVGLPPVLLDDLEKGVHQICEKQGFRSAFVHVGFLGQPDEGGKNIVSATEPTGDLTFLGLASESAKVRQHFTSLLSQRLSAEQLRYAKIHSMAMDEFVGAYGWLIEKLTQRQDPVQGRSEAA